MFQGSIVKDNGCSEFTWEEEPERRSKLWKARHDWWYAGLALKPGAKVREREGGGGRGRGREGEGGREREGGREGGREREGGRGREGGGWKEREGRVKEREGE